MRICDPTLQQDDQKNSLIPEKIEERFEFSERDVKINGRYDLILKDGKVYFKLEQWSDIDAFKQDRNMRDGWIQRYLSGESDWEGYSEMIPFEYNYYWSDLSNDAY